MMRYDYVYPIYIILHTLSNLYHIMSLLYFDHQMDQVYNNIIIAIHETVFYHNLIYLIINHYNFAARYVENES